MRFVEDLDDVSVRVLDGNPTLFIDGRSSIQPTDITSFGTQCAGPDFDNTYVLGEEFYDAAGIGPPIAEAGGPYNGLAGQLLTFSGSRSRGPDDDPLEGSPLVSLPGTLIGRRIIVE